MSNKQKLGNFIKLQGGYAFKSSDFSEQGVPIVRISNIRNNKLYFSDAVFYNNQINNNLSDYLIEEDDVLIAMSGATTGKVGIASKDNLPAIVNQRVGRFVIQDKEKLSQKFLRYLVQSSDFINQVNIHAIGGAQPNISVTQIESISLYIPQLIKEQQKIAEILSSVDAAIDKTEQVIAKTEEVKKGLMQQLLTKGIGHKEFKQTEIGEIPIEWEISLLGDVVERIVGGGTPSRDIEDYYEGDIPWFTVKDMIGIYLSQSQEYITEDAIQNSATNLIEENNVIVATRIGLGKAFINQCDITINQDLKALFPKKEIISTDYLLLSILGQAEKIIGMGSGTTVKGIRLEQLKKLNILLPPLKEQQRIISIFNQIEQKLGNENNQYNLLVNLKHGLMQQLLTGQVRVKVD